MRSVYDIMTEKGLGSVLQTRPAYNSDRYRARGVHLLQYLTSNEPLQGVAVGNRYTVLQNTELAALADELAARMGLTGDPTVTAWEGGTRISVTLPMGAFSVGLTGQDRTETRVRIDNVHGSGAVLLSLDTLRLVCLNGMRMLVSEGIARIPHTASVLRRLELALRGLDRVQNLAENEARFARRAVSRPLSQDELRRFFLQVHERVYGPMAAEGTRAFTSSIERVAAWVRNLEDPRQTIDGIQGTLWAALQAVIQWADHEAPARDRARSADHGSLAQTKVHARQLADTIS